MSATGRADAAAAEAVREAARTAAPDFYLPALLAPRPHRDDLVTLAALTGEISRIGFSVTDPNLALIKLQWWRDALAGGVAGGRSGHPVADAAARLIKKAPMLRVTVDEFIEAHDHLIASGEITDAAGLDAYIGCTVTGMFRAAQALIEGKSAIGALDTLIAHGGRSYALIRLAVDLPYFLARGRRPLPLNYFEGRDPLGLGAAEAEIAVQVATRRLVDEASAERTEVRREIGNSPQTAAAILPLALVGPYSRALQKPGRRPLTEPADIPPATRAWRLWLASWRRTF